MAIGDFLGGLFGRPQQPPTYPPSPYTDLMNGQIGSIQGWGGLNQASQGYSSNQIDIDALRQRLAAAQQTAMENSKRYDAPDDARAYLAMRGWEPCEPVHSAMGAPTNHTTYRHEQFGRMLWFNAIAVELFMTQVLRSE